MMMKMKKQTITIIIFIISSFSSIHASTIPISYTNFIKNNCKKTTYPPLCLSTLTPYALTIQKNPSKLCIAALNVSLQGAKTASTAITKIAKQGSISSYQTAALKDCISVMKDAIYEINLSLVSMKSVGGANQRFQLADALTQASAALTNEETCKDGFAGRKTDPTVRKMIKSKVAYVENRISNALYLINHLYK